MTFFWQNPLIQNQSGTVSAADYVAAKKKLSVLKQCSRGRRVLSAEVSQRCHAKAGLSGIDEANRLRSAVEVYEFVQKPPREYVLYIDRGRAKATTWTGEVLGDVSFGQEYGTNMGDRRVPVRVRAINGRTYAGTYFKSAGDYARVRLVK